MSGPSVDVVWDPQAQMNSLDCWDYSIELSCLQGPEGIRSFVRTATIRCVGKCADKIWIYERSPVISFLFSSNSISLYFRTSVNESLQRYNRQFLTFTVSKLQTCK